MDKNTNCDQIKHSIDHNHGYLDILNNLISQLSSSVNYLQFKLNYYSNQIAPYQLSVNDVYVDSFGSINLP
jgi:hypothetical protein